MSTGFKWEHHDAVTKWSKGGRIGAKPVGSLGRTDRLAELHAVLREKAPLYGIGRIELVPVRKSEAIGFYLGGYLAKSLPHKPVDAKRTRSVNYSHLCPRTVKGPWSWVNEYGWLWRAKLAKWASFNGCADLPAVKAKFGPKWAHREGPSIWQTVMHWYPDARTANSDFRVVAANGKEVRQALHTFPDDAVSICIARWDEDGCGFSFPGHADGSKEVPPPVITAENRKPPGFPLRLLRVGGTLLPWGLGDGKLAFLSRRGFTSFRSSRRLPWLKNFIQSLPAFRRHASDEGGVHRALMTNPRRFK